MKIVLSLLLTSLAGIAVVVLLFNFSRRNEKRDNGFFRAFPSHITSDMRAFNLGVNSYYVAGFSGNGVYLGNYTVPNQLLRIDNDLKDSSFFVIPVDPSDTLWGGINVRVDSANAYIMELGNPKLRYASLRQPALRSFSLTTRDATIILPLNSSSVFGKRYNSASKEVRFFKENLSDSNHKKEVPLGKTDQSLFTTDGIFAYRTGERCFFYTDYYTNRFRCIDTNLVLIYEGRTIDTFSSPNIRLATTGHNSQLTFSSTPRTVNKLTCVSDSLLLVYSNVRANNQSVESFRKNMVVDVYYTGSGKYLFSFNMPYHNDLRCSSFDIHHNVVYAIYDTYLISFKLNLFLYRGRFD